MIKVIAFDADDTLWHSESLYVMTQERFKQILASYEVNGDIDERLYETEMRNLKTFGYGAKGFTLSMIETAIELTDGRVQGKDIQKIIGAVREMMRKDIRLLDSVAETIPLLARNYTLMMITKGDLLEQESKIARSGLADYFRHIEIVSSKNEEVYQKLFDRNGIDINSLLMVGNSLPSDVLPILALGAPGVHIPYKYTWSHEQVELEADPEGLYRLDNIAQVPRLLERLDSLHS
jgi:putative hydrolase of the HAD superfamily